MSNLSSTLAPVKSAPRNRVFGLGVFPQRAERLPVGPSAVDREWAALHLNIDCRDYVVVVPGPAERAEIAAEMERADALAAMNDAEIERMAEEAAWQESYEAGYCHA